MRIEMLFFNFVASLVLMSLGWVDVEVDGQNTRAPKAPTRVVNAYCDDVGAHVVYESGQRFVQKAKHGERCSNLKISDDRRAVGWRILSEARAEDGDGHVIQRWTQSDLFVNRIQVKYEETALHEWRFHNGGRQVVIVAGPLTGDGNMFLYDIDGRQIIDECIKRRQGVTCADWAK